MGVGEVLCVGMLAAGIVEFGYPLGMSADALLMLGKIKIKFINTNKTIFLLGSFLIFLLCQSNLPWQKKAILKRVQLKENYSHD